MDKDEAKKKQAARAQKLARELEAKGVDLSDELTQANIGAIFNEFKEKSTVVKRVSATANVKKIAQEAQAWYAAHRDRRNELRKELAELDNELDLWREKTWATVGVEMGYWKDDDDAEFDAINYNLKTDELEFMRLDE